ncbi:MAG TPA: hypothetical protein VGN09_11455 [Vicinamibacteria bacterium]|jgi:hypothetical protein
MTRRNVALAAAAIVLALPAGALAQLGRSASNGREGLPSQERYRLRLEYREWRPDLTGTMLKGSADADGTIVDLNDDLALEKDRTFQARGEIQFKAGQKLRGSYTKLNYHGDVASAPHTFSFGESRFVTGNRVVTTLKGAYYSADLEWDFVKGPGGFLGALVGARMLDVDRTLVSPTDEHREADTLRQPQPVIGVVGRGYAGRLSVEGEIAGLSFGSRGSVFEFDGSGRFHLSDRLAVQAGYRVLSAKPKDGADAVEFRMGGWHFGLELSL